MKTELVTVKEAIELGLTQCRLLHEGHGAFGEPDNTYINVVFIDNKVDSLSDNDLILFRENSFKKEIIQIISEWNCSDKLLEIMNPKAFDKRKKDKYEKYIELKKEIESQK